MALAPEQGTVPTTVAEWTFLLYLGGVNSLAAEDEALLLSLVGSSGSAGFNFVYELGTYDGVERGRIYGATGAREVLSRGPRINTASPKSLTAFIDWAEEYFPSRYVALVIKDHGGGLDPAPGTVPERAAATGGEHSFFVLDDDVTGEYLSNPGLREAIERTRRGRVDILGFDACSMSVLELAYELRNVASFMVASQSPELTSSWLYARLIEESALHLGPRSFAMAMVLASPKAYLAAIELSWMENLAGSIDKVAGGLLTLFAIHPEDIALIQSSLTAFQPDYDVELVDLGELLRLLRALLEPQLGPEAPDEQARRLFGHVEEARKGLDRACIEKIARPVAGGAASGILILFPPSSGSPYLASYGWLEFTRKNRWTGFLGTWCSSGRAVTRAAPTP